MNMMSPALTDVGALDDIPRLGARCVTSSAGPIAIFRTADDQIFAVRDECPHKQGPLSQGIVHGNSVTCPLHGWVISLRTGEADAPDVGCAKRHTVHVQNGRVLLEIGP
jgi:nitrite reductase (NADH) small subunit